jgi:hypothetical protein
MIQTEQVVSWQCKICRLNTCQARHDSRREPRLVPFVLNERDSTVRLLPSSKEASSVVTEWSGEIQRTAHSATASNVLFRSANIRAKPAQHQQKSHRTTIFEKPVISCQWVPLRNRTVHRSAENTYCREVGQRLLELRQCESFTRTAKRGKKALIVTDSAGQILLQPHDGQDGEVA